MTTAGSSATEPARFAIVSRRRRSFYLQRPDGSPLTFDRRPAAEAVGDAPNREDPNDDEPEYAVTEVEG